MWRTVIAMLGLMVCQNAMAGSVVVWLEEEAPDAKSKKKASAAAGESEHMSHLELACAASEAVDVDTAFNALKSVMEDAKGRWDEFEVEIPIATELQAAIDAIPLVRNKADRDLIIAAKFMQGAAVARGVEESMFAADERARPFRLTLDDGVAIKPWVEALALDPDRAPTRDDVIDGGTFSALEALQPRVASLAKASVDVSASPSGADVLVDGRKVEADSVEVGHGAHWVHIAHNNKVCASESFEVAAGSEPSISAAVSPSELAEARTKVLAGEVQGLPADVQTAVDALVGSRNKPTFLAAMDGSKVVILPYAGEAEPIKRRPVTVLLNGELGGARMSTSLFDGSGGSNVDAFGVSGSLGLEVGIYNLALLGGCDVTFTPGATITPAGKTTDDIVNAIFPAPYGGIGAYVLRPSERRVTLLLAGTAGLDMPAHVTLGGRLAFGVPVDDTTWLRLTLGAKTAGGSSFDVAPDKNPLTVLFGRLGLAARF